jgi:hypothetical protein
MHAGWCPMFNSVAAIACSLLWQARCADYPDMFSPRK